MKDRIIKSIRYYERKPTEYVGEFDGLLGNIYRKTSDTDYIGKRVARKLNEFEFSFGEVDHVYIYFSNEGNEKLLISENIYDKRILEIQFFLDVNVFNNASELEKDKLIFRAIFDVLYQICEDDLAKKQIVDKVQHLLEIHGKEILIKFKRKETKAYIIELDYQIAPEDKMSKGILKYTDKKTNVQLYKSFPIHSYEDLYNIIGRISVIENRILLHPKKSYKAELAIRKNETFPFQIEMNKMKLK